MSKKVVTFGEIMLRLSPPGFQRFGQARSFDVIYGGGESNVAVSLANYGMPVEFVTRLPANDMGDACIQFLRQYGVGTDRIVRGGARLGIYFLEMGAMQRGSKVIYDRAGSSIATIEPGMIDWRDVFRQRGLVPLDGHPRRRSRRSRRGVRRGDPDRQGHGPDGVVRPQLPQNLWKWGKKASESCRDGEPVRRSVGNEEAAKVFGIHAGHRRDSGQGRGGQVPHRLRANSARFDRLKTIAITLRARSRPAITWSGVLWDDRQFYTGRQYDITHIVDRVGGGDSFMGG